MIVVVDNNDTPNNVEDDTFTVIEQCAPDSNDPLPLGIQDDSGVYMIGTREWAYTYEYLDKYGYTPYRYTKLDE